MIPHKWKIFAYLLPSLLMFAWAAVIAIGNPDKVITVFFLMVIGVSFIWEEVVRCKWLFKDNNQNRRDEKDD